MSSEHRAAASPVVRLVRAALVAAGALATAPVAATLVLRQVDVTHPRVVAYVAGTPVVVVAGLAAIALLAVGGSRIGVAVAAVLTAVLGLTQVPLFLGTAPATADATPLTVMTINLHHGEGDADQVVGAVRELGVDVLAAQELTTSGVAALRTSGIGELLGHEVLNPGGVAGGGIWSDRPLRALPRPDGFTNPPVAAMLDLDGIAVFLATVHPTSPYPDDTEVWSAELRLLRDWLAPVCGPAVVLGDFNATADHRPFRELLAAGFQDVAAQVGAGWLPTFPANRRTIPPLVAIDHVLGGGGVVATAVRRVEIWHTDHLALVADLAVPARPPSGCDRVDG